MFTLTGTIDINSAFAPVKGISHRYGEKLMEAYRIKKRKERMGKMLEIYNWSDKCPTQITQSIGRSYRYHTEEEKKQRKRDERSRKIKNIFEDV